MTRWQESCHSAWCWYINSFHTFIPRFISLFSCTKERERGISDPETFVWMIINLASLWYLSWQFCVNIFLKVQKEWEKSSLVTGFIYIWIISLQRCKLVWLSPWKEHNKLNFTMSYILIIVLWNILHNTVHDEFEVHLIILVLRFHKHHCGRIKQMRNNKA